MTAPWLAAWKRWFVTSSVPGKRSRKRSFYRPHPEELEARLTPTNYTASDVAPLIQHTTEFDSTDRQDDITGSVNAWSGDSVPGCRR